VRRARLDVQKERSGGDTCCLRLWRFVMQTACNKSSGGYNFRCATWMVRATRASDTHEAPASPWGRVPTPRSSRARGAPRSTLARFPRKQSTGAQTLPASACTHRPRPLRCARTKVSRASTLMADSSEGASHERPASSTADSSSSTAVVTKDVLAIAETLKGVTMVKPNTMSFEGSPQVEVLGVTLSRPRTTPRPRGRTAHGKVRAPIMAGRDDGYKTLDAMTTFETGMKDILNDEHKRWMEVQSILFDGKKCAYDFLRLVDEAAVDVANMIEGVSTTKNNIKIAIIQMKAELSGHEQTDTR
jgi:hypothetical protein